jgi:LmbE family N-acetylglucosaminyl deacetylase
LFTLTKGEATKQRFRIGVSKEEMGDIRYKEMQCVEKELDLNGMTVFDLPDDNLKEMDPADIEEVIRKRVERIKPDVLVTYAVHGISGFDDHLVSHAVVKSVYCDMKREGLGYPKRLAFFTHFGEENGSGKFKLSSSDQAEIDCWIEASNEDYQKFEKALDCYETYQQVIEESNVKEDVGTRIPFEIFQEDFDPPLSDLGDQLSN